jgi:hypothetical protein
MRKPKITLAYNEHRNRGVVSFRKMTGILHEWKAPGSSKTTEMYTHITEKSLQ